jgi:hypothetical protein
MRRFAVGQRAVANYRSGSILRVRNFLPERSVWARLSLSAFNRNLAQWSQLGPAGAFSTSLETWGSTQRGKGISWIWEDRKVRATREWEGRAEDD